MTDQNEPTDSQSSPSSINNSEPSASPLQEAFSSLNFATIPDPLSRNQKIEIVFSQGHRLCLQGSFDWDELHTWLTPLLIRES